MIPKACLLAVVMLAGCSTPSGPASPTPRLPVLPSGTTGAAAETPAATATQAPLAFDSTIYPYGLTLPGGVALGAWTPATREWTREIAIYRRSADDDDVATTEGVLFVLGMPWSDGLPDFEKLVLDNVAAEHTCETPIVRTELTIGIDAAIGLTQVCATNLVYTRVLIQHDNYALAVSLGAVSSTKQSTILEELVGWLAGLRWRT